MFWHLAKVLDCFLWKWCRNFIMFYIVYIILVLYIFLIFKKVKKYKYNQKKDYIYDLKNYKILDLKIDNGQVEFLCDNSYDTLVLEVYLKLSIFSYIKKPYLDIDGTKHYFEYGAKGKRFLNISYIQNSSFYIKPHFIGFGNKVSIYGFTNDNILTKKILVVAPHADDAEIASFGLYKSSPDVSVVTITAGESGVCNYCELYNGDIVQSSLKKGLLRSYDALSIPLSGGVKYENIMLLGYFVNRLKDVYQYKQKTFSSKVSDKFNIKDFRIVEHAKVKLAGEVSCSYKYIYDDIKKILNDLKPDLIITPHTQIDAHKDHIYSTLIFIDAVKDLDLKSDFLLYTNHLKTSETYPVGEMFSSMDLPPNFKDFYFDSIYSFELDDDLQKDKFFALESNHDLRDSLVFFSIKRAYRYVYKMLKRYIISKDKSYFKRSVRSNELFFVVKNENLDCLR